MRAGSGPAEPTPAEPSVVHKVCRQPEMTLRQQVKCRKYKDLDFKVVDDDGETIPVLGVSWTSALSAPTLAWQVEEPPDDKCFTGGL